MRNKIPVVLCSITLTLLLCGPQSAAGQAILGSAQSFAVLGASTVINTGPTTITGNLGISPGTSLVGFPPGIVSGTIHIADGVALQGQNDATTAYNTMAGLPCGFDLTGQDLGGLTLVPGVYCFGSSAQLTGALTLDALGNPAAEFIFQIGSTLTTASGSTVSIINGGSGCNVHWVLGSSATLGSATTFLGNVLASASITLTTSTVISGRLFALSGAVTLDANAVAIPQECQCTVAASVTSMPGCGHALDPVLSMNLPVIGQRVNIQIASAFPNSAGWIYISLGIPTPLPIPGTNCTVWVAIQDPGNFHQLATFTTDALGNFSLNLTLPYELALLGVTFTLQARICDPTTPGPLFPFPDWISNGLYATIGCP